MGGLCCQRHLLHHQRLPKSVYIAGLMIIKAWLSCSRVDCLYHWCLDTVVSLSSSSKHIGGGVIMGQRQSGNICLACGLRTMENEATAGNIGAIGIGSLLASVQDRCSSQESTTQTGNCQSWELTSIHAFTMASENFPTWPLFICVHIAARSAVVLTPTMSNSSHLGMLTYRISCNLFAGVQQLSYRWTDTNILTVP